MLVGIVLACATAALASAALSGLVVAAGVTDFPDRARKVHKAPTPTSGGLAIGSGFALGLALLCFSPWTLLEHVLDAAAVARIALTAAFAFGALTLGLVDDLHPLTAQTKTALMIALSLGVALFVARVDDLPVMQDMILHLGVLLGVLGSAAWVFVLMNATNFMDGANGLAMGSTAISLAGLSLMCALCEAPATALAAAAGAGALAGFLAWNWPLGKLFAGDSGALFAGALGAIAALTAVSEGGLSPFVMPVLFFPVLADALLTLAWRITKGRRLFDGHREHFYQIALRAQFKGWHVTLLYWLATLGCAAAAVTAAALQRYAAGPDVGAFAAVATLAPKLVLLGLTIMAVWLSGQVRAFATARGLDG